MQWSQVPTLRVSVDGGSTSGVRVGVVGSKTLTLTNADPIKGRQTDIVVTWSGSSDLGMINGGIALEFSIPDDATVFAFSV